MRKPRGSRGRSRVCMSRAAAWLIALTAPTFALTAAGQEPELQWHLATSASVTPGTTGDYLGTGWIMSSGVRWNPPIADPFAMQGDLHYTTYSATRNRLYLADSPYLTAGIGEYWRRIHLGQTVLVAGSYCDPWWGFCYSSLGVGTFIRHEETTARFAWNVGGGAEHPFSFYGFGSSWFIDVRYHHLGTNPATELIPIQIGIRF